MKHKGTILIETDRLILRKFKDTDSNNMFKNWGSDANVTKYLSWQTHKDIKDSEEIINLWISKYEDNSVYNWVMELKEINEVIGNISIVKLEDMHDACEASGKVMQKCGMVYEGTLREVQIRNNKFCSLAVYSILKKEWISNALNF